MPGMLAVLYAVLIFMLLAAITAVETRDLLSSVLCLGAVGIGTVLKDDPLPVNLEYTKDPRYLGRSAWRIVERALEGTNGRNGPLTVQMSKEEI